MFIENVFLGDYVFPIGAELVLELDPICVLVDSFVAPFRLVWSSPWKRFTAKEAMNLWCIPTSVNMVCTRLEPVFTELTLLDGLTGALVALEVVLPHPLLAPITLSFFPVFHLRFSGHLSFILYYISNLYFQNN